MRDYTIVVIQVIKNFFAQLFCIFFPSLLDLFCFYYVFTISVLYYAHLWMKCPFDISNLLEELSSLTLSVVFLYIFALFTEEGLLVSPAILWNSTLRKGVPFSKKKEGELERYLNTHIVYFSI